MLIDTMDLSVGGYRHNVLVNRITLAFTDVNILARTKCFQGQHVLGSSTGGTISQRYCAGYLLLNRCAGSCSPFYFKTASYNSEL